MPITTAELSKLRQSADINLFELSNHDLNNSSAVWRFTDSYGVTFGSNTYQQIGCKISSISLRATGEVPSAELYIADTLGEFSTLYNTAGIAVVDATLTHFVTLKDYIGTLDATMYRSRSVFRVSNPSHFVPKKELVFSLEPRISDLNEQHGRILDQMCSATYQDATTGCPYPINGALATCSGKLSGPNGCKAHFPSGWLPFMGTPFIDDVL
jgi:hypothetical protein